MFHPDTLAVPFIHCATAALDMPSREAIAALYSIQWQRRHPVPDQPKWSCSNTEQRKKKIACNPAKVCLVDVRQNRSNSPGWWNLQSLANALGISRAAVSQWGENVPPLREYQLRELIERREKAGNRERQKAAWMPVGISSPAWQPEAAARRPAMRLRLALRGRPFFLF